MNPVLVAKLSNGSLLLSTVRCGQLIQQTYYGYTVKEARSEFAKYCRGDWR